MTGDPLFNVELLYLALDRQRRRRHITWGQIGREAGLPRSVFTRLGRGHPPGVETLARLLLWLGDTDVAPYLKGGTNIYVRADESPGL